ncbi:hypothetical protein AAHA92_06797 [Salvia divinorum]|uniref:Uncharacterized protein n=1 Tax=Salvia divinorum TaxID=28513 RepID=A0ABD1I6V2_SALDI
MGSTNRLQSAGSLSLSTSNSAIPLRLAVALVASSPAAVESSQPGYDTAGVTWQPPLRRCPSVVAPQTCRSRPLLEARRLGVAVRSAAPKRAEVKIMGADWSRFGAEKIGVCKSFSHFAKVEEEM